MGRPKKAAPPVMSFVAGNKHLPAGLQPLPGHMGVTIRVGDADVFEVTLGRDGRSIEVRGVGVAYRADNGVMYGDGLVVEPNVSNSITVRSKPWPGQKVPT